MIIENRNRRKNILFRKIYFLWYNMKRRCLDVNNKDYKYYGAKGVKVCERWMSLDNFIEDIDSIKGFDKELFISGLLTLDKDGVDLKGNEYSLENCEFISKEESNKRKPTVQKCFEVYDNDILIGIFNNQSEVSRLLNIKQTNISYCLRKGTYFKKRYKFKYI